MMPQRSGFKQTCILCRFPGVRDLGAASLGGWGLGSLTRLQPRFGPGLRSPTGLTGTNGSLPKTVTQLAFAGGLRASPSGALHRRLECPRNMAAHRASGRGWERVGLCLSWPSLTHTHRFCSILFIRGWSLSPAALKGRGIRLHLSRECCQRIRENTLKPLSTDNDRCKADQGRRWIPQGDRVVVSFQ